MRSCAANWRTDGSAAPGLSSPDAIATLSRAEICAYKGVGLRGSMRSNMSPAKLYHSSDTVWPQPDSVKHELLLGRLRGDGQRRLRAFHGGCTRCSSRQLERTRVDL